MESGIVTPDWSEIPAPEDDEAADHLRGVCGITSGSRSASARKSIERASAAGARDEMQEGMREISLTGRDDGAPDIVKDHLGGPSTWRERN